MNTLAISGITKEITKTAGSAFHAPDKFLKWRQGPGATIASRDLPSTIFGAMAENAGCLSLPQNAMRGRMATCKHKRNP
jgi:hypothetical protein